MRKKKGRNIRLEDQHIPDFKLPSSQIKILKKTSLWASSFFEKANKEQRVVMGGHGFDHNQRVSGMAIVIAAKESHDPFLPALTGLIFDIGRTSTDPRAYSSRHGELGREMAQDFVNSLPLLGEEKEMILNAIEDHPKLNEQIPEERRTWLVKILMDADRLDSLGALGPVRAAAMRWKLPLFADSIDTTTEDNPNITTIFQDFAFRVPRWFESMWTDTGRAIASSRMPYMKEFVEEFRKEADFMHKAYRKVVGLE